MSRVRWSLPALLAVVLTASMLPAAALPPPPGAFTAEESREAPGLADRIVAAEGDRAVADPAGHVDPFMGTLGAGFVFPGPAAPFGMVQLSPDTEGYFAYTGYQWADATIRGFSHVHISGMGVPATGNVPFMPTTGSVLSTDVEDYQSPYTHADEEAEPGYYRVRLARYGVDAELTAGTRVGVHRYTFPPGDDANVLLDIGRQIPGGDATPPHRTPGTYLAAVEIHPDDQLVVGTANPDLDGPHGYPVHFAARFDTPFAAHGTWAERGDDPEEGATSVEGDGAGAYVSFAPGSEVTVKVGISFTGVDGALANLEAELPGDDFDFDRVRAQTYEAWNDALSVIDVEGGTPADRIAFSTMLYRAQHHPNVFSDADGAYLGHDGNVHRVGHDVMRRAEHYYTNFSLWDTYRGQMPLLMLIAPERVRDMVRSLAAMGEHDRLPRWAMMNRSPNFMTGEPALPVISDAWCRGLVDDDIAESLYASALHVATDGHRHDTWDDVGYIPFDTSSRAVTDTLEHALTEFALALVADRRHRTDDRDRLLAASERWRNTFDADDTRFARPRYADGAWEDPWSPMTEEGFQEGTSWQYTWLVPHDVRGLFDAIGAGSDLPLAPAGDDEVVRRLDQFFMPALVGTVPVVWPEVQQKITGYGIVYLGNQYPPSNQHALHTPYLYNWVGQPWKSQHIARGYQGLYRPVPDGIPGNDDLGTLASWYVWSALGMYPAVSGAPLYALGSPVFERATVDLGDGQTFTVEAPGASYAGRYVQEATLGGEPLDQAWIGHEAIAGGQTLRLEMGPVPNTAWASDPAVVPPSASTHDFDAFGCRR